MARDADVLLVFPPVWQPEAPFLSTAILSAYLKERDVDVAQWDLNAEFWTWFTEPMQIRRLHASIRSHWEGLSSTAVLTSAQYTLATSLALVAEMPVEEFEDEVASGIISPAAFRSLVQHASEFAESDTLRGRRDDEEEYHDVLFSNISKSQYAYSSKHLLAISRGEISNPFVAYLQARLDERLKDSHPMLIGISIAAVNQVVPAFTLARLVKEKLPKCHVVIGGSWCTQVGNRLRNVLGAFSFIDSVVTHEGEEPLYRLYRAVAAGASPDGVPNLYRPGQPILMHGVSYAADMNQLPAPDFDDIRLSDYDYPGALTIQASRGCYWGRCTFCSYPLLEPSYKVRQPGRLIRDIKLLKQRYGATEFGFVDALLSPTFARRISEEMLRSDLAISWTMFARLEPQFTTDLLSSMAKAGCSMISWGLESASARVLGLIDKSIDLSEAATILSAAAAAGIHNRLLVMYGHPTETEDEVRHTLRFIEDNIDHIHSISFNFYHPEVDTPIEGLAAKLGITLERDPAEDLGFGYTWFSSLSKDSRAALRREFERLSDLLAVRGARLRQDQIARDAQGYRGAGASFSVEGAEGVRSVELFSMVMESGHQRHRKVVEVRSFA